MQARVATRAMMFAIAGTAASVAVNEVVFNGGEPQSIAVDVLKSFEILLALATILQLYRFYELKEMFQRLTGHLRRNTQLDLQVGLEPVFRQKFFWLEVVLVGLVLPPHCSALVEFKTVQGNNLHYLESIFCIIASLRVYLVWRVVCFRALRRFPRKATVSDQTDVAFDQVSPRPCVFFLELVCDN